MASPIAEVIASFWVIPFPAPMRSVLSTLWKSKLDKVAVKRWGGVGSSLPRSWGATLRITPTLALMSAFHRSAAIHRLLLAKAGGTPGLAQNGMSLDGEVGKADCQYLADKRGFTQPG